MCPTHASRARAATRRTSHVLVGVSFVIAACAVPLTWQKSQIVNFGEHEEVEPERAPISFECSEPPNVGAESGIDRQLGEPDAVGVQFAVVDREGVRRSTCGGGKFLWCAKLQGSAAVLETIREKLVSCGRLVAMPDADPTNRDVNGRCLVMHPDLPVLVIEVTALTLLGEDGQWARAEVVSYPMDAQLGAEYLHYWLQLEGETWEIEAAAPADCRRVVIKPKPSSKEQQQGQQCSHPPFQTEPLRLGSQPPFCVACRTMRPTGLWLAFYPGRRVRRAASVRRIARHGACSRLCRYAAAGASAAPGSRSASPTP